MLSQTLMLVFYFNSTVEVAGLFQSYSGHSRQGTPWRPINTPSPTRARYTHTVVCLSDHLADMVPNKFAKLALTNAGIGEKLISFQGKLGY